MLKQTIFLLAALLALAGCRHEEKAEIDFRSKLSDLSELRLAEMSVSKVGCVQDGRVRDARSVAEAARAAIDHLKVGKRIGIYSYDTYLMASVDLGSLTADDITADHEKRHVSVTLPPLRVAYAGRDMKLREEHVRVTGLRSDITPQERAALKKQMAESLQREVAADPEIERELRRAAASAASAFVGSLASQYGYTAEVHFR